MKAMMKKFFVAAVMAVMIMLALPVGLSAKEKKPVPILFNSDLMVDKIIFKSDSIVVTLKNIGKEEALSSDLILFVDQRIAERRFIGDVPGNSTRLFSFYCRWAVLVGRHIVKAAIYTVSHDPKGNNFLTVEIVVGVGSQGRDDFDLRNYPNPFNSQTTIRYFLPSDGNVKLTVFDMLGKEVAVLIDGYQETGEYQVTWNASQFSSGNYFYCLESGRNVIIKMMTLMK